MSQAKAHEITVEDVRKLAMPLSAHIISGEGRLDRAVTWATVIHPEDDLASKSIQKHELILFAPVSNPSKARTDSELVRWSAEAQAAAVAFSAAISPTALAEAKAYHLPVMALSSDTRVRDVERTIIRLLAHRKSQMERRAAQIYRQLTEISARNEGMDELIGAMARLTKKKRDYP